MTKKVPRLTFKCWNCKKTYTLKPDQVTEEQELIVPCPYCEAEAVVKLEPFKRKVISTLRGGADQPIGVEYDFPEVIPTQQPEE